MIKRMTAEVVRFSSGLRKWQECWDIELRNLKTGKINEFTMFGDDVLKSIIVTINKGDILDVEYTAPTTFLEKIFGNSPSIHNITKVRCVILERQLAKIPRIGASRGGNVGAIANELSDKSSYNYYRACCHYLIAIKTRAN